MTTPLNFSHLPQISLSKLYESSVSEKISSDHTAQIIGRAHHEDIIVQSPFYERPENCKGPCTCAYHRMKRYKQLKNILRFQTNSKMRQEISRYKSRIAEAVRGSNRSDSKLQQTHIKPVRKYRQTEKINIDEWQKRERRIRKKYILDNYNYFFDQILRKRLSPMQDHQKVATLIKFIKIQSNIDPNYLKKIRDYICLNLLKIVQKIPFSKLLQANENDEEVLKTVAHLINGKHEQALNFLRGVRQAMKDMESYLIQKSKIRLKEELSQQNNRHLKPLQLVQKNNINVQNKDSSNTEKSFLQESQDKLSVKIEKIPNELLLNHLQFKNEKSLSKNSEQKFLISEPPLSPKKRGTFPSKKSTLCHNQNNNFVQTKIKSNSRGTLFKESFDLVKQPEKKKSCVNYDEKNLSSIQRQNMEGKKEKFRNNSILLLKKKSSKKFQESQHKIEEMLNENQTVKMKVKNQGKDKKRMISKIKHIPNQFNSIEYSKLITKEEFDRVKYLLSQHNTLPVDDQMQKLLGLIERRLSAKPQFLEEFIEILSKVLTPEQIKILRQKHDENEYKKMIKNLTKQVDNCLYQLRQSSVQAYKDDQQEPGDKANILMRNLLNLECVNNQETLFDEFNKFKIVEKTPPPAPPVQEPLLDQKQLGDLFLQQIMESSEYKYFDKQKFLKPREVNTLEIDIQRGKVNEQKHRQILRYMKKNHPFAFNSVKENIKDTLGNSINQDN